MPHSEDAKTIDLPQKKRSRGRPRLAHALTAAERAKRYRDKMRARMNDGGLPAKSGVTKNAGAPKREAGAGTESAVKTWRDVAEKLEAELKQERRRAADLRAMAQMFIDARMKKKTIPADVFRNIQQSLLKL